jgi:hypothetical protein
MIQVQSQNGKSYRADFEQKGFRSVHCCGSASFGCRPDPDETIHFDADIDPDLDPDPTPSHIYGGKSEIFFVIQ